MDNFLARQSVCALNCFYNSCSACLEDLRGVCEMVGAQGLSYAVNVVGSAYWLALFAMATQYIRHSGIFSDSVVYGS